MTKAETAQIIAVLQVNYPDNFKGKSDAILDATVNLWHSVFQRDPYPVVQAAVMAYIQISTERFMPNVGMIREQIRKITLCGTGFTVTTRNTKSSRLSFSGASVRKTRSGNGHRRTAKRWTV